MTIKIGLIGSGGIAGAHIRVYLKVVDEARVTAVCDVVTENAQQRAEELGGAAIYSDYRDMLASADIDAVDVCLPHHLHKDAIVAAAQAGKHILCEKPLCLSLEQAAEIKKVVAESGVTLMCAHNQLFIPAVQRARQLLDEGLLGQVYEIRTTDSFYHSFKKENMGWRAHREFIGGGDRYGLSSFVPAALPGWQRTNRGHGHAQSAPSALYGWRRLCTGAGTLCQWRGRQHCHKLGLRANHSYRKVLDSRRTRQRVQSRRQPAL